MGNMRCRKRGKIVLVPYPAQGHVTPMLKLGQALVRMRHGLEAVMVTPEFIHRRIISGVELIKEEDYDGIVCMSIPDDLEEEAPRDFFAIETAMENNMPLHLERLVRKLNEDGGVVCIIVDLLASWAINVAKQCGVTAVGFWPAMLATYQLISAIPHMLHTGLISETGIPQHLGTPCFLPCQPMLSTEELPWLIGTLAAKKSRFKFWTRTLDRSRTLQWILVNSFPEECNDNKHMESSTDYPHIFPVGPLSMHAVAKNPSLWEEDRSCLDWLDKQKSASVVYVSFGSWVSPLGEGKVKNLALGLEASGRPFIWVLGATWREGLPVGFLERVSKQGKVVSWAPQMEVLQHEAVGCYLTHCGWNSTMEAIQCRKRLLCYPVAGDQFVNCTYIVKVWNVGVRINGFGQKDVEEGVRRVMEDSEMNSRLMKLNEKTIGEGANSRVMANLTAFIDDLKKLTIGSPINALCGLDL